MPIPQRLQSLVQVVREATSARRLEWNRIGDSNRILAKVGERYIGLEKKNYKQMAFVIGSLSQGPKAGVVFRVMNLGDKEEDGSRALREIDSFTIDDTDGAFPLLSDLADTAYLIADGVFSEIEALERDLRKLNSEKK